MYLAYKFKLSYCCKSSTNSVFISFKMFQNTVLFQNNSGTSGIPPPPVPKDDAKNSHSVNGAVKNKQPEPDYEVIEFGQYSNAPLVQTKVPKSMIEIQRYC